MFFVAIDSNEVLEWIFLSKGIGIYFLCIGVGIVILKLGEMSQIGRVGQNGNDGWFCVADQRPFNSFKEWMAYSKRHISDGGE